MNIMHSLLGLVAQANASLSRQSINFVPGNLIIIGISLIIAFAMFGIGVSERDPMAIFGFIPAVIVFGLFSASTLKRDTFFLRDQAAASSVAGSTDENAAFEIPVAFTGKLRLDEKTERRFLNVPVSLTRLGGGELAFASRIDASTRMYSVVTKSRVGVWLSLPSLQNVAIENGALLHGKTPLPSIRVQYEELSGAKPKRVTTILSFKDTASRDAIRAFLQTQTLSNSPFTTT